MPRTTKDIIRVVESQRRASADRDQRWRDVHDVRSGDIDTVIPGSMPEAWPKPIVANMVDTAARDMAEVMGVMPSINCSTGVTTTDKAKKFSSKKTKIANHYVQCSGLHGGKQVTFADHFISYGMGVYVVEADFEKKRPHIRVENPMGTYIEKDIFGRVRSYTKVWREEAIYLVAKFPWLQREFVGDGKDSFGWEHREIEVVKYIDADRQIMYLPQHAEAILMDMENPLKKVYISAAFRPGYDKEVRGAFDDAIWVQLAKSRIALLGLEATEKSIRAPLVVPRDVQKMQFGDDAVIRTDGKVERVGLDVPQFAFQEGAFLDQEMRQGTRSPEARTGNVDASIITGRGVQALMGGFNTVVTTGQTVISEALKYAIELAFEMDEKLWPDEKRTIRGTVQGSPFEETYVAGKDIKGDYTVDVTYGFAAGQDPARAIVGLLQLRGDQLISRDFFQRQLPMEIDVNQMQIQIDIEQLTDAAKQGIMAYASAIPQMALQGQDPTEALEKMAKLIELREKGKPVHEALVTVFKSKEQPAAAQSPFEQLLGSAAASGPEAAAGAMGAPVEGAPQGFDLQSLLTGLKGTGEATMSVRSQRQQAI